MASFDDPVSIIVLVVFFLATIMALFFGGKALTQGSSGQAQGFLGILVILGFFSALGVSIWYTKKALEDTSPENATQLRGALNTIIGINTTLVFLMMVLTLMYLRANTGAFLPFTVIMMHANFLVALISLSMSVITKMS